MPDHTISDRPRTHTGVPVYAGALDAEYGVDSPKPLDRNSVPGVEVDVFIDTEELKMIGVESGPPAALCNRSAVRASSIPPSKPRVKSDGAAPPGLPHWKLLMICRPATRSASAYSRVIGLAPKFAPGCESDT